jgi:hypothetical protein
MNMGREKVKFPSADAYQQGLALLENAIRVEVRNEKRRVLSASDIPDGLRPGLAELGATISSDRQLEPE